MPNTLFRRLLVLALTVCIAASAARSAQAQPAATTLSVVSAGPRGEVGSLADANEFGVVFSESMMSLRTHRITARDPQGRTAETTIVVR